MAAQVILVEAWPRRLVDGVRTVVRLAGAGGEFPYFYEGEHWRAGLTALPSSDAALDFDGEQLGGGGVPNAISLTWAPATNKALAEVSGYFWKDAPITVRIGEEGEEAPPIDTIGVVLDTSADKGVMRIGLADVAADLKRQLLVDRYAGTGGIEGPVEWDGTIKSRAWGRCFNVPGRMIVPAANIVCFGDPTRKWQSFDAIRDKGVPADQADLTLLAWQGSAAATLTALQNAQTIEGGGVLAPSIACVKWWTVPAGDLHADIHGEIGAGYVETAAEIAARIVAARSTIVIGPGEIATAAASRPAPFGWRCDTESTTAADAISEMLGDVGLSWLIVDGLMVFRPWDWVAPVRRARSVSVSRREVVKPTGTRRIGYRRNQAPMARGDLAAAVLAGLYTYADGTPFEDLKPATPGATAGAPAGSFVAGVEATEAMARINFNADTMLHVLLTVDQFKNLVDSRTFIEGQLLTTRFLQEHTERVAEGLATNSNFVLLGAKSPDGSTWILNVEGLVTGIDPVTGQPVTMAQKFTQLGVQTATSQGQIDFLLSTVVEDDGILSKAVLRVTSDGSIAGYAATADGKIGRISWLADEFLLTDPNGGNPFNPFAYSNNRFKMSNVEVDTLTAGSVTITSMAGGFSSTPRYTAADVAISATAETTVIETPFFTVGDGLLSGRASATVSFIQDALSRNDVGARIRIYVDTGSGYGAAIRDRKTGIATTSGQTYWALPVSIPINISTLNSARIKITAIGDNLGGRGYADGGYARDIAVDVLRLGR